jgi:predicted phage baseplate assembly protein
MRQPAGETGLVGVKNLAPATGGANRESVAEAQRRVRRELKMPFRAVTPADWEYLARSTPGLRVARARAVPLKAPGSQGQLQDADASVTVVVVPYSSLPRPTPSHGFLQTVCRHLDKHRLLTTRVHAVAPDYVRVSVVATVVLRARFETAAIREYVLRALDTFLHPLTGGPNGDGWPFGRTVYKSEVYQQLENVAGVDCVQRLALTAEGSGAEHTDGGDITIPSQSLVYAGDHLITLLTPDQARQVKGALS